MVLQSTHGLGKTWKLFTTSTNPCIRANLRALNKVPIGYTAFKTPTESKVRVHSFNALLQSIYNHVQMWLAFYKMTTVLPASKHPPPTAANITTCFLVLILQTCGGMARLSWPGWLVAYSDKFSRTIPYWWIQNLTIIFTGGGVVTNWVTWSSNWNYSVKQLYLLGEGRSLTEWREVVIEIIQWNSHFIALRCNFFSKFWNEKWGHGRMPLP